MNKWRIESSLEDFLNSEPFYTSQLGTTPPRMHSDAEWLLLHAFSLIPCQQHPACWQCPCGLHSQQPEHFNRHKSYGLTLRYLSVFTSFKIPRQSHCWAVHGPYNMLTSWHMVKTPMWFIYLPLTVTTLTYKTSKTACSFFFGQSTCFPRLQPDLDLRQQTPDLIVMGSDSNMSKRQDKGWLRASFHWRHTALGPFITSYCTSLREYFHRDTN